jgi:hypothetical protein
LETIKKATAECSGFNAQAIPVTRHMLIEESVVGIDRLFGTSHLQAVVNESAIHNLDTKLRHCIREVRAQMMIERSIPLYITGWTAIVGHLECS